MIELWSVSSPTIKPDRRLPDQGIIRKVGTEQRLRAWLMMAQIAMLKAMNHGRERVFSDRTETLWGKRKLKRDK